MTALTLLHAVLVGVVATLALDVVAGAGVASGAFRIPRFGRWGLYALRGTFRHADIERASPLKGENALTLPLHYVAGIVLVVPYLLLLDTFSWGTGNLVLAAAYGLATSLIPLLLMLPSMGYGLLGLRHGRDTFWLREIVCMHLGYGVGIGIGALLFVT